MMFKHVLLPTDGSELAMRAVRAGVELARSLGADVTVMTAMERLSPEQAKELAGADGAERRHRAHEIALARLDSAEKVARAAGVRCHRILARERSICRGILEAAHTAGADLIVMGTHGMSTLERLKGGSQTHRVLVRSGIPVLTMH